MSSDHFSPWSERQGESGFAWSWLGAAMATTSLPFGVVTAPGQRYHPAIIAQAVATLTEMFPGRLWVALGTGEASNEHITGDRWPRQGAPQRAASAECVEVMRALFAGEEVTHHGLVDVDRARLWTLPATPPSLIGAAVSAETAAWVGGWADGLITVNQDVDALRATARCLPRRRRRRQAGLPPGARVRGRRPTTRRWRSPTTSGAPTSSTRRCAGTSSSSSTSTRPPVRRGPRTSASGCSCRSTRPGTATGWPSWSAFGFDGVWIHHVGQEQRPFIDVFGEHVVPDLQGGMSRAMTASPRPPICGGRTPSSTASTCRRSPTPTATASATSPA